MAFNLPINFAQVPSSSDNVPINDPEDQFYAIIERLKNQKVLSRDSFIKELPFFNFSSISKESQIKELFQDASDPNLYKNLIKNIISMPEGNSDLLTKRLSAMQVMGFAQIILYKVLPCCEPNCPNAPREVAPRNQYKDYEYSCPFYHHDKDRRRLVITPRIEEEFTYKANYLVEGKGNVDDKEKHSLNYFESMYHPLYYKMFKCKREYCNFSQFCPFFHSEEEKKTWDNMFSNFIRKDRVSYVKDKQKYYESSSNGQQHQMTSSPTSPNSKPNDYRNQNNRPNYKQRNGRNQQTGSPLYQKPKNTDWKVDRRAEPQSAGKWENNRKNTFTNYRKDSGESFDGNSSPISFGTFYDSRETVNIRMC